MVEHSPMTICLPVMSTEALLLYQTVLFWHTECYATEMEQLEPSGVMTTPNDQFAVFITAVLLSGNVMPKFLPARVLLSELMQSRYMKPGAPLLSIIRNADEWLADANVNVTLLLSPEKNVFNGDTELPFHSSRI